MRCYSTQSFTAFFSFIKSIRYQITVQRKMARTKPMASIDHYNPYLLPTKNRVALVIDIKTEKIVDNVNAITKFIKTSTIGETRVLNQPIEKYIICW